MLYLIRQIELVQVALVEAHTEEACGMIDVHTLQLPRLKLRSFVRIQGQIPQSSERIPILLVEILESACCTSSSAVLYLCTIQHANLIMQ